MKIVKQIQLENCHFYSREKSLYIAWACFRNEFVFEVLGVLNGTDVLSWVINLYMKLVVRKPVSGVSDQVPHKPGCTATEDG